MYNPTPVDTSSVTLPSELSDLTEKLAENAHENWSKQRMKDGWTFGEKRDNDAKTHPDLIPYAELSDPEKEYDRITAMETLKTIVSLGHKIQ